MKYETCITTLLDLHGNANYFGIMDYEQFEVNRIHAAKHENKGFE